MSSSRSETAPASPCGAAARSCSSGPSAEIRGEHANEPALDGAEMSEVGYPLIAHHGVIGDLQTAALVSTSGRIDWYCCPRFDSPSVFALLLNAKRGGGFQIAPEQLDTVVIRQLYIPDTAILVTRFMAPTGVGEVVDFMPIVGREPTHRHQLVRLVRVIRGAMRFRLECAPRFDFARRTHHVESTTPSSHTGNTSSSTARTSRRSAAGSGASRAQRGQRAARPRPITSRPGSPGAQRGVRAWARSRSQCLAALSRATANAWA
jgi:hypothetical protein